MLNGGPVCNDSAFEGTMWKCGAMCPLWVNQANLAFHPFGVGKWVAIHVIIWIAGVETIKRRTRAVRVVVWLEGCKLNCAGLAYSL